MKKKIKEEPDVNPIKEFIELKKLQNRILEKMLEKMNQPEKADQPGKTDQPEKPTKSNNK